MSNLRVGSDFNRSTLGWTMALPSLISLYWILAFWKMRLQPVYVWWFKSD